MRLRHNSLKIPHRFPFWVSAAVSLALVAIMAALRLGIASRFIVPIGYGVPLIIIASFRQRRLLWGAAACFVILTVVKYLAMLSESPDSFSLEYHSGYYWITSAMIIADLLVVTTVATLWIEIQGQTERQNVELDASNSELLAREEQIARANEELRSQTEELERQSEELRLANEELAARERILQILLDLSRSLTTQLSRNEIMTQICETLKAVVNGTGTGVAILERRGEEMSVQCHYGFGTAGLTAETLPLDKSFASLILARDRTGYLEDANLRSDLKFPQPIEGPPFESILATPLRVRGNPIGTLEVYKRDKGPWTPQQVGLAESMAAQTSVSLEAGELFEQVNHERHRFETVLRTLQVPVMVADAKCEEVRVNPAGASLFGVAVDENVRPQLHEWTFYQNGRMLTFEQLPIYRACRDEADIVVEELEWIAPAGRRAVLLSNARPFRDAEGKIVGAVAAYVDITPQKELQRELDLRRREAEEASVRKTRFLAAVSHDIRTPANAIGLLAELVRRTADNPATVAQIPELAGELRSSAISLVNLLNDVLDVARFDSGKVEMQESEFALAGLLEEEHRQLLPLAREKGIQFEWNLPQPIRLRTDRIKLARILGNLIGNAIKFTDQGSVRVEAAASADNRLTIRVIDTGTGIPVEAQRHIFDEFFQLRNPERDRNKGTGLGLTICKRLVDAMGGTLEVSSVPGQGSVFTVTLPASCVI